MPSVRIHGDDFEVTDRGSGRAVLLVHGFPLDHSMWHAQIDALADRHRVLAPDLRGFGRSVVTAGTVTMQQHADDLAAMLDALDIEQPVVLCGLSMGGYVAWQFWRRFSHRLAGLVLCDTRAGADSDEARKGRLAMAEGVIKDGTQFVADAMLPKLLAPQNLLERSDLAAAVRRMIESAPAEGVAAAQRGMAERPDVTAWLPEIDVPTLLLVGAKDVITPPAEMRTIAEAIPNAQLVEIPDAGHMSPMENAGAVNGRLQRFLATIP